MEYLEAHGEIHQLSAPALAEFFSLCHELLCVIDPSGTITQVNPAFTALLDYVDEQVVNALFMNFVHPQDRRETEQRLAQLDNGPIQVHFFNRFRQANGTYIRLSWRASLVDGMICAAATAAKAWPRTGVGLGSDRFRGSSDGSHLQPVTVPEPASAGSAAEAEQPGLVELLEAVPDIVHVADASGMTLYLNPAGRRLRGFDLKEDLSRVHFSEYFPEWATALITAEAMPTAVEKGTWVGETALLDAGGREIPVSHALVAHKDEEGKLQRFSAVMRDIRRQKRTEAERAQLVELLEAAPEIIGMADKQGRMIYLNSTGRRLLLPDGELRGVPMSSFVPKWAAQQLTREAIPASIKEGTWIGESAVVSASGEEMPVLMSVTAHKNKAGRLERFSAMLRSIEDLKQAQHQLRTHASEMETVAEVSAAVATIREMDLLLQQVVDLTRERFDLYHSHIYLLNAAGDRLVLTAGAGDVGRQMVAEQRSIALDNEKSLVGRSGRQREAVIVNDVEQVPDFLPHPLLPETRAELAVPLVTGDELIGVLDVQSDERNHFTEEDANIYTTLASQIAVAVVNARLFEQTEAALSELSVLTRRLTREGWDNYLQTKQAEHRGFLYDVEQVSPVATLPVQAERLLDAAGNGSQLDQPIVVHGATIGRLAVAAEEAETPDEEAAEIMAAIAQQLGARIENLRLTEQTESALVETETLFGVSTSLNVATTLEEIVTAAVQPALRFNVSGAGLFLVEEDEQGVPEWAEFAASWQHDGGESTLPIGLRVRLADFSLTRPWLHKDISVPLYIEQIVGNEELATDFRMVARNAGANAIVFYPLLRGDQMLGFLSLRWQEPHTFDESEKRLYDATASQAATILDRWLLLQETQERATETRMLYEASRAINTAQSYDAILQAVREHTVLGADLHRISLNYFSEPWQDEVPEWLYVLGEWGAVPSPRSRFHLPSFPAATEFLRADEPVIIDFDQVEMADEGALRLYTEVFGATSTVFIPLVVGGHWIGYMNAMYQRPVEFTTEQLQRLMALAGQAATAVQGLYLLNEARERARREQVLREVTANVRSATDVDLIMKTAVREVGRALGREAFVYLGDDQSDEEEREVE